MPWQCLETWRQVVVEVCAGAAGPVSLAEIYRALAAHPKALGNQHWRAKVRQVLQQGPFRRVDRGVWAAA